ncbi:hypothetical protein BK673_06985 [Pseudomonas fluorescens]|uniref:DUF3829 domain-containing protein n=1 Tax=Pseudomonas fluorescens TaxID=294 RepID=A0A423P9J5_PSEFL|nr:DUF3829 domain-containing protein [Pseudomonas fluorescens]ROO12056.1 hypothetical protein BK673_06985 [Pseudomonas fluorescens]
MTSRFMFVSGVVVVLVVMGLASATRPFLKLDLWLDQRESPVTAQANALSPIIACVNRVDVHWRNAYDKNQHQRPTADAFGKYISEPQDFDNSDAFTVRDIQEDTCLREINEKLELLAYQPALSQKVRDYAQALKWASVISPPTRLDRSASFFVVPFNQTPRVLAQIQTASNAYISASTALREELLPLDVAQRLAQLKVLEARVGKEIHWSLLAYMIQARETLERLEDGMKHRTLTPQAVAETTADLQQAWNRGGPFIGPREPGFRNKDDDARELWRHIREPAQHYLEALNTLHKDWQDRAEPQRLSDDYYAVTRGYDALLSHYNRQARANF